MDVKGEIMRRTGLDAATVDKILGALGEIVSERYPQFAGMIGPMLGVNTGTTGTSTGTTGAPGTAQGFPDMSQLGGLFGGGSGTGGTPSGGSSQGGNQS